jgi:hypothetical protein
VASETSSRSRTCTTPIKMVIIIINHFCLDRFREISGACWVGMVLPNPLTRFIQPLEVSGGSNRFIIRAVCASNGAIGGDLVGGEQRGRSLMSVICTDLVLYWPHTAPGSPWCSTPQLGTGRSTGLSTDMLGCREAPLAAPEKVLSITRKCVFKPSSGPYRGLQGLW